MGKMSKGLPVAGAAISLIAVIALGGCGGDVNSAAPETVTIVETQEVGSPTEDSQTTEAAANDDTSGLIEVPDVVGLDHQLAQDTMQAAGLYNLAEEDATGQGRMLLWDRNWVVVEQDPSAGTMVAEDQTIVLKSKKKTD